MKRICPRCNNELSTNCYVKDKGINTLSYLELIIKKDQFNKEHKEIKSCYCPKCGYVELYVDVDHQNQHLKGWWFKFFKTNCKAICDWLSSTHRIRKKKDWRKRNSR